MSTETYKGLDNNPHPDLVIYAEMILDRDYPEWREVNPDCRCAFTKNMRALLYLVVHNPERGKWHL